MNVRSARWFVFNIWYCTLLVIIGCFFIVSIRAVVPIDGSELIKSITLITGLVLPTLGAILIFYKRATEKNISIGTYTSEFYKLALMCSVMYHVIFWILLVFGVALLSLVPPLLPEVLYRNCTFIVNVMGLFSILLGPAAWLFGGR